MKILIHIEGEKIMSARVVERTRKPPRNLEAAIDFVYQTLAKGPVASIEMFIDAEKAGIGRDKIYAASKKLGVIKRPIGYRACDGWLWELKNEPTNMAHQSSRDASCVDLLSK